MDFSFSDEQQLLRDSVRRFITGDYDFATRRRVAASEEGFSRDNWRLFAELGWLGAPFPEDYGGSGGGPVEIMILMEEFGRGLVVEPYIPTVVLGGGFIARGGSEEQRARLLPQLIAGGLQLAFAGPEPQSRFDLADIATTAQPADGGYVLSGHKAVVANAPAADLLVVAARTGGGRRDPEGITLFLVDAHAEGLSRRSYPTVDGLRAAEVQLDQVRVGADTVLGEPDNGLALIEAVTDAAIVALGAEGVGIMDTLLRSTVEYTKTREQFGQPIGSFQVLQHRMVDMFMECEQARSLLYMAMLKLDAEPGERRRAVSAFKARLGEGGRFVGQQAIQLHGGMGMTDELGVGHYFKRLSMIDMSFGNADYHLGRFADTE